MTKKITQLTFPPGFIDLGTGIPGLDLLPLEVLEQAAARYFDAGDRRTLQYGAEQGSGVFLEGLADWLAASSGYKVHPDRLITTGGASSALDLLCTLYTEPGDLIFVEDPTYFLALRIFADHGLEVEAVSMDEQGLDLEELEDKLTRKKPKFLYSIPTYHNPASVCLSQARRERLVRLAEEHGFLLVADEVYRFLGYAEDTPRPLASYAQEVERVISLNSFSKILAPGLRLGWIEAHPGVVETLAGCGLLDSGGGFSPFTSAVVDVLIRSGDLSVNLRGIRKIYQKRLKTLDQALATHLPEAEYRKPGGGYYFWVRLPGADTRTLREQARKAGIDFRPGPLFSSRGGFIERLRLSFSCFSGREINQGIARLAEVIAH